MRILTPVILLAALLAGLHYPIAGSFSAGPMLEPLNGLWSTARAATPWPSASLYMDGMQDSVRVTMDERGVPHIKADDDLDAIRALGYVVARDRLFEMDFIHRVSTGQLSALLGEGALGVDRYFHEMGIVDAVRRNTALLPDRMPREFEIISAYAAGANAWLADMNEDQVPLEYRLLGGAPPDEITPEYTMALYAFMAYDLSFRLNSDRRHAFTRAALGDSTYQSLFPEYSTWEVPIVRADEGWWTNSRTASAATESVDPPSEATAAALIPPPPPADLPFFLQGFLEGKGSNNWAVDGSRSVTGMPILAGDMHLSLTLPAIWYEAHLITPTANVYGVTFVAVPGIVEGITPTTAWAFTNTGADQLDTYRVQLNTDHTQYLFDGEWRDLRMETDSISVKDGPDTAVEVAYTHFGPVISDDGGDFVVRWVGHEFGTTMGAFWEMNRAKNYEEFLRATRQWDYPMQNILYAGRDSLIAIRSTGYLPVRGQGNAFGIIDGTTSDTEWIGRVPFDELPYVIDPAKGYLASTNQRPAPEGYPHYLGQDWSEVFRSVRIDQLLSDKARHSADDLASYQADQVALQVGHLTAPLVGLEGLTEAGERLRRRLEAFDGNMNTDSPDARLFDWYYRELNSGMWDEPIFRNGVSPKDVRILELLEQDPSHVWFDRVDTPERETAEDVFRLALEYAATRWAEDDFAEVPWGDVQTLQIQHITNAEPLRALWREDMPFGGYRETLSPASRSPVTFSASWRVIVDFSESPPIARGVYPGGQSGNPFSRLYDAHLKKFIDFDYYPIDLHVGQ